MGESKIEFSIGDLSFAGEGEEKWLAMQLDKIIKAAPDLAKIEPPAAKSPEGSGNGSAGDGSGGEFTTSLANHIKEKGGETSQVKRFLATADWLRRRGNSNLTTGDISKALSSNHQKRLSNPADNLNQNVSKGHCEKKGKGFFITPEGKQALGY